MDITEGLRILVVSSGNIYALDLYNHRIQKKNSSSLSSQNRLILNLQDSGILMNAAGGGDNIYVTDFYNFAVRKYNTSLSETATYGGGGGTRLDAVKK